MLQQRSWVLHACAMTPLAAGGRRSVPLSAPLTASVCNLPASHPPPPPTAGHRRRTACPDCWPSPFHCMSLIADLLCSRP